MADEEQQNEDKKRRVLEIFLNAAGTYYPAFADEQARRNAVAWFHNNFEWREEFNMNEELAANDMTETYGRILASNVDSEAKREAEFKSERKKPDKRAAEQTNEVEQPKKPKQSSRAGSSSDVPLAGPAPDVPLAGPAPDAVSALVAFLRAFAAMTEAEQRALLEKLQRQ